MRETVVEKHLRDEVKKRGGKCWKLVTPGRRGIPDRLVLYPEVGPVFVEVKAPGKTERDSQDYVHEVMRNLNCKVFSTVDSKGKVDEVIKILERWREIEIRTP